jgi:hypothetical protein
VGWLAEEGAKGEARDKRREKRETQKINFPSAGNQQKRATADNERPLRA